MPSEKIKTISEIAKNVAEVVALIVAGLWAYTQFHETEGPSLELRSLSESKLVWFEVFDPIYCAGEFSISIKNIGKKSFDLKTATIRIWLLDVPPLGQMVSYVDTNDFLAKQPTFEKRFSDAEKLPLLTHFPPGTEASYDFTFSFKFDKKDRKIAQFGFIGNGSGLELQQSRWDYLCGKATTDL